MLSQALILTISGWLGAIAVILIASISPEVNARPPLIFKYPYREKIAALLTAAGFLLLAVALAVFTPNWIFGLPDHLSILEWSIGVLSLLMVIIAFMVLHYRKQPLLSFGWNKKRWKMASRIGLSLIFLSFILSGSIYRIGEVFTADSLNNFLVLIVFNLAWETALRGFIQPRLSAWLGQTWGWLATSLLGFLLFLPLGLTYGASPDYLITFAGNQILLGWIMKRSGHIFPGAAWAASFAWFLKL
jgi:hypothetical protein